jgi:2-polyprenyl-3-methyl-5-hydroxy-6-metoxy-1,4-benzoquinol methylase
MPDCNICLKSSGTEVEQARVRSNVRKFRQEQFAVWRCPHCSSIHASEQVDLDSYYRYYPIHDLEKNRVDWMLKAMYRNLLHRLKKAGLQPEHRVLDYGCGSGALVDFLRKAGYPGAIGYDEYGDAFSDPAVLEQPYDLIISQDVLEHVPDPWEHLRTLNDLCKPGGVIALGTPNAEAIDLRRPEKRIHTLHQPFHRHILSRTALLDTGRALGWTLLRYYPTMYTNTLVPFVNTRFVWHYLGCFDDTLDLVLEPIHVTSWRLFTPLTLFYALFGGFFAPETDVMAVFRRE